MHFLIESRVNSNGDIITPEEEEPIQKMKIKRINPVYQEFDNIEGVEDLYRVAEFCVQPSYLYKHLT